MIGKLRKSRDKKGIFTTVLTDLSKAFDCIRHNLLISKLSAYDFDRKSKANELLEPIISNIFTWFKHNGLLANSCKYHFLISSYAKINLKRLDSTVVSSCCLELMKYFLMYTNI